MPVLCTLTGQQCGSEALTAGDAVGKKVTTIEGLAENGVLTKVQQAWIDLDVPQCGYCQSGMIMAVFGFVEGEPEADRRRHRQRDHQYLSVRNIPASTRGDSCRGQRVKGRAP